MCVAAIIETTEGPSALELWQMGDANPHGAGLAWAENDVIRYRKGLDWKSVLRYLKKIPRPALLHFRWATHGPKVPHLTHPFPLGPKAFSKGTYGHADAVLIHNGTWGDWRKHVPRGINPEQTSDTAAAAYAAEFDESILDGVSWATAVARAAGNGRMDITLRGTWTEYGGNQYSNLNWQPSSRHSIGGWSSFDADDWSDYWRSREATKRHLVDYSDTRPIRTMDRDVTTTGRTPRWRDDGVLVEIGTEPTCGLNDDRDEIERFLRGRK